MRSGSDSRWTVITHWDMLLPVCPNLCTVPSRVPRTRMLCNTCGYWLLTRNCSDMWETPLYMTKSWMGSISSSLCTWTTTRVPIRANLILMHGCNIFWCVLGSDDLLDVKLLGCVQNSLHMRIVWTVDGITLDQEQQISQLADDYGFLDRKSVLTPNGCALEHREVFGHAAGCDSIRTASCISAIDCPTYETKGDTTCFLLGSTLHMLRASSFFVWPYVFSNIWTPWNIESSLSRVVSAIVQYVIYQILRFILTRAGQSVQLTACRILNMCFL